MPKTIKDIASLSQVSVTYSNDSIYIYFKSHHKGFPVVITLWKDYTHKCDFDEIYDTLSWLSQNPHFSRVRICDAINHIELRREKAQIIKWTSPRYKQENPPRFKMFLHDTDNKRWTAMMQVTYENDLKVKHLIQFDDSGLYTVPTLGPAYIPPLQDLLSLPVRDLHVPTPRFNQIDIMTFENLMPPFAYPESSRRRLIARPRAPYDPNSSPVLVLCPRSDVEDRIAIFDGSLFVELYESNYHIDFEEVYDEYISRMICRKFGVPTLGDITC